MTATPNRGGSKAQESNQELVLGLRLLCRVHDATQRQDDGAKDFEAPYAGRIFFMTYERTWMHLKRRHRSRAHLWGPALLVAGLMLSASPGHAQEVDIHGFFSLNPNGRNTD